MNAMNRSVVVDLIRQAVYAACEQAGEPLPLDQITETTRLFGSQGVLDSMGLTTVIVDVEQEINDRFGLAITLADERAMSQKSSPFRSVQSLADYILTLVEG